MTEWDAKNQTFHSTWVQTIRSILGLQRSLKSITWTRALDHIPYTCYLQRDLEATSPKPRAYEFVGAK